MISSFLRSTIFRKPSSSTARRCRRCAASRRRRSSRPSSRAGCGSPSSRCRRVPAPRRRRRAGSRRPGSPCRRCRSLQPVVRNERRDRRSSDIPHTSQIGIPIAAKNSNTSRGPARHRSRTTRSDRSRASRGSARARARSARPYALGDRSGDRLPRLLGPDLRAVRARSRPAGRGPALLVGLGFEPRLERGLQLLPDPGTAPNRLACVRDVGEHLRRVGAARDGLAPDHLPVVARARGRRCGRAAGRRRPHRRSSDAPRRRRPGTRRARWRASAGRPSAGRWSPRCRSASARPRGAPRASSPRSRSPSPGLRAPRARRADRVASAPSIEDDQVLDHAGLLDRRPARSRNCRLDDDHPVAGVAEQDTRSAPAARCCRSRTGSRRDASPPCRADGTRAG